MELIVRLFILIYSIILHELAHGLTADRLGDPTPRLSGRLTLNPKNHIDPFMSVLFPLLLLLSSSPIIFGGAKPMPVDPFNFREGRKDIALVALAGPLLHILLAIIATILIRFLPFFIWAHLILSTIIQVNLFLAIFNLLPIPPLDGSRVFALLLPEKEARAYLSLGNIGMMVLFFLLFFPIGGFSLSLFVQNLYLLALRLLGLG